jgi:DmsE family decaheme c-type cytochrome
MLHTQSTFRTSEIQESTADPAPIGNRRLRLLDLRQRAFSEVSMKVLRVGFSMRPVEMVTRRPKDGGLGMVSGLRVFGLAMVCAGILYAGVLSGQEPKTEPAVKPAAAVPTKDAAQNTFVGGDVCATCHEEVAKKFAGNAHTRLAAQHGAAGVNCEGCHGPGGAHVEGGGDISKIFNPAKASAKEVDRKCLSCHEGKHSNFERSAHGEANVSCVGCHDIHGSKEVALLKAPQPMLCYQCHTDVKPQFSMPFHHKVNEGLVQCSDCHDPHGTFEKKGLKTASQQDAVCVKCHTETAGPWVFEHNVVKTEGCTACHTPHGGPNPRLLNRANVNTICLQCHSPSQNFTTSAPLGPAHNQAAQYQSCTICHSAIHGSNTSGVFFNSTE